MCIQEFVEASKQNGLKISGVSSSPLSTLGLFSMLMLILPQSILLSMHSRDEHRKSICLPFWLKFPHLYTLGFMVTKSANPTPHSKISHCKKGSFKSREQTSLLDNLLVRLDLIANAEVCPVFERHAAVAVFAHLHYVLFDVLQRRHGS